MAGLPTITVKLDDGTGTFPYDISAYVKLDQGITITAGRSDELSTIQASTCTLTLDNSDGRFTFGSTTPYNIAVDRQIRVSETINATTYNRFTGYVQEWPAAWPDGSDVFSTVTITASDLLARLSRGQLRSVIEEVILADHPIAYYTMGEGAGTTTATDSSGNGQSALKSVGTGAAVVFGNATGPAFDSLTALQLAGGKYLQGTITTSPTAPPTVRIELSYLRASVPAAAEYLISLSDLTGQYGISIGVEGGTGKVFVWQDGSVVPGNPVGKTANSYTDNATHHILLDWSYVTSHFDLWVDGAVVASLSTNLSASPFTNAAVLRIGHAIPSINTDPTGATGTFAHVAIYTSTVAVAVHSAAEQSGLIESADTRIKRVLGWRGITSTAGIEAGVDAALDWYDTSTKSPATVITDTAVDDGGAFYIDGSGNPVYHNRQHRALRYGSPAASLTADDLDPGSAVTVDMQLVRNDVTVTTPAGASVRVINSSSNTAHGQYPATVDSRFYPGAGGVDDDVMALGLANWLASTYGEPSPRLASVQIDLLTQTVAKQQAIAALTLDDAIALSGLPSQTPGGTSLTVFLDGWTEVIADDSWTFTVNTSPARTAQAWILGDATLGVLGSTTRIHY